MSKLVVGVLVAAALAAAPGRSLALHQVEGRVGAKTLYGIWVPDRWNGDLVLYAHGFRNPNCPLAVPTDPVVPTATCPDPQSGTPPQVAAVRDTLLSFGYAFAASSYSETGFALKEGVKATLQLGKIFSRRFGTPSRTYLYGHSMGGAIVLKLAEQHPKAFDGALVMCGMIGGSPAELQYVVDARATFDAFFPGVAPGNVKSVPPQLTFYGDVLPAVLPLFDPENPDFFLNFAKAAAWASSDQVAFPFASFPELVQGILELLYNQTLATPGVVEAAGGFPASNEQVAYSWSDPDALSVDVSSVDGSVKRVRADPLALTWAEDWYDTTGAISFPVMTVHTIRDAAVPMLHERLYAKKVAAAGRSHLLVQRTVSHAPKGDPSPPPDGHCTFKPAEELAALADLLGWVATGTRPAGGDATVDEPTPAPVPLPPGSGARPERCDFDEDELDADPRTDEREDRRGRDGGRHGREERCEEHAPRRR
ncbi:MAG: serine aminopeptidase domain-containing protein [Anaeromyxobacteraceae bacterium]